MYTCNQYTFSAVSGGGPRAKSGQAMAQMPDQLLRPWSLSWKYCMMTDVVLILGHHHYVYNMVHL